VTAKIDGILTAFIVFLRERVPSPRGRCSSSAGTHTGRHGRRGSRTGGAQGRLGKFLHQGQLCTAVNRIIVAAAIRGTFVNRFVELARALRRTSTTYQRSTCPQPFGGQKNGGFGRFGSRDVVEAFTTQHRISLQQVEQPLPF
jgi:hypothetical protein